MFEHLMRKLIFYIILSLVSLESDEIIVYI